MSFWSLIGLPDKNDIRGLKSEINALKEENKVYAEMNNQLLRLAGDLGEKCDMISEILSTVSTQLNTFKDDTNSEFITVHADVTEIRNNVLSVQSCSNELDKRIQQLSVDMEKINSGVTTINDIDSELKSLTEFVNCLWSATKALWIDSLISDFDNSFNFEADKIVNSERQAYKVTKNSYESGYGSDYYWSIDNERD